MKGETKTRAGFTAGPWERDFELVYSGDGSLVAGVFTEADARLIAASPDLLEALEAVEWTKGVGPFCPACTNRKKDGHRPDCTTAAAITKATEGD